MHRVSNPAALLGVRAAANPKEDSMPSTLIATCPLCGLRFANRALLDLHLREDHPRRRPKDPAEPSAPDPTP
jgi:hypothetical protein